MEKFAGIGSKEGMMLFENDAVEICLGFHFYVCTCVL